MTISQDTVPSYAVVTRGNTFRESVRSHVILTRRESGRDTLTKPYLSM